jgi:phosphoglycolate phosphatase
MRGVIFDLDGTLVDSLRDISEALDHVLSERGLPRHSHAEYERMVGDGARILVRRALADRAELEDEVLAAFKARYLAHVAVHTRPYDGIEALLDTLTERGVPMAVLSNKPHPATETLVRALFPHPFVAVRGTREEHLKKPDPTAALEIARAMELAPDTILFLGDTAVSTSTAARAGMVSVGALWGMRSREELERAGARHLIAAPGELLALL